MRRWRRRNAHVVRGYTRERYRKLRANPDLYSKHLIRRQRWVRAHPEVVRRRAKQYRKKNLAKVRAYHRRWMKRWYRANRRQARERRRRYRLSNLQKWRAWDRKYYRNNLRTNAEWVAQKLARGRLWAKRNLLKQRHRSATYRARRIGAKGSHTLIEWMAIVRSFRWKCFYCGLKLSRKTLTKDHRKPLSKGGTNFIKNVVPACKSCNSGKAGRLQYRGTKRAR
jgi:5-methylcytosine-specific restriction endonuclease McrA